MSSQNYCSDVFLQILIFMIRFRIISNMFSISISIQAGLNK